MAERLDVCEVIHPTDGRFNRGEKIEERIQR